MLMMLVYVAHARARARARARASQVHKRHQHNWGIVFVGAFDASLQIHTHMQIRISMGQAGTRPEPNLPTVPPHWTMTARLDLRNARAAQGCGVVVRVATSLVHSPQASSKIPKQVTYKTKAFF